MIQQFNGLPLHVSACTGLHKTRREEIEKLQISPQDLLCKFKGYKSWFETLVYCAMVAATAWWPELAGAWENFQGDGHAHYLGDGGDFTGVSMSELRKFYILFCEVCWMSVYLKKLFKWLWLVIDWKNAVGSNFSSLLVYKMVVLPEVNGVLDVKNCAINASDLRVWWLSFMLFSAKSMLTDSVGNTKGDDVGKTMNFLPATVRLGCGC